MWISEAAEHLIQQIVRPPRGNPSRSRKPQRKIAAILLAQLIRAEIAEHMRKIGRHQMVRHAEHLNRPRSSALSAIRAQHALDLAKSWKNAHTRTL